MMECRFNRFEMLLQFLENIAKIQAQEQRAEEAKQEAEMTKQKKLLAKQRKPQ